jgi:hypothetical protein
MGELVELLAEAFEELPRSPAAGELSAGIKGKAYWSFDPHLESWSRSLSGSLQTGKRSARGADGWISDQSHWSCFSKPTEAR